MKRREALTGLGAMALAFMGSSLLSSQAKAETEESSLTLTNEIGTNHGHSLEMTPGDLIAILRELNGQEVVEVDMQGFSRHPHTIFFTEAEVLEVLKTGQVSMLSSRDFGHPHEVIINLAVE